MPSFRYEAYDTSGTLSSGSLVCATREEALEHLGRRRLVPVLLEEASRSVQQRWWQRELPASVSFPPQCQALLLRDLATLVASRIAIDEALRILSVQPNMSRRLQRAIAGALERLLAGESLSATLEAEKLYPKYICRVIEGAEKTGQIADVLDELATGLEHSVAVSKRLVGALLYPAVLLAAATVTMGVVLGIFVPALTPIFEDAGVEPPLLFRIMRLIEAGFAANAVLMAGCALVAMVAVVWAWRAPTLRRARDRILLRLPVIGQIVELHQTRRYALTLGTLLKSGLNLHEAVLLVENQLSNRIFEDAAKHVTQDIAQGVRFSDAIAASNAFDTLAIRLSSIGEQSGQLDLMLLRLADITTRALEQKIERLTQMIAPCLTIGIGLIIAAIVYSVMSAIIGLNELAVR